MWIGIPPKKQYPPGTHSAGTITKQRIHNAGAVSRLSGLDEFDTQRQGGSFHNETVSLNGCFERIRSEVDAGGVEKRQREIKREEDSAKGGGSRGERGVTESERGNSGTN